MAKTNYTKVEEALAEGLRKIEVNKLLDIADENAAAKKPAQSKESAETKSESTPEQKQLLLDIKTFLKQIQNLSTEDPYQKLGIDKKQINRFVKHPEKIKAEDWEKLKGYREKIKALKDEVEKKHPPKTDINIVEQQRKKQKTKRFNINDKWIPLK